MTVHSDADLNQAAADAACSFLQHYAPAAAPLAVPYVPRLFAALADGHSFIWLSAAEAAALAEAAPLVSRGGNTPLVLLERRLFLGRMWQLERDLAAQITRLAQAKLPAPDWLQAGQDLHDWFAQAGSEGQRDAAALALLQAFMLISGGPGTGKTTTVAKLLALLCNQSAELPRIALAAPTGKAAQRLRESLLAGSATDFASDAPAAVKQHLLLLQGQTVHRLLKLRAPQMRPQFNEEQPLPLDILIIDEASMLDIALLLQLLRAVPDGCRVVLLGD
ncbi:MAG TPA: AAA family ATPase, partial [Neisseria sp.]|nr:AAA family ATPase [Neisseria sp.]